MDATWRARLTRAAGPDRVHLLQPLLALPDDTAPDVVLTVLGQVEDAVLTDIALDHYDDPDPGERAAARRFLGAAGR